MSYYEEASTLEFSKAPPQRVLLPIGSVEQHGPHACLGTDLLIAKYIAECLSKQMNIPTMPYIAYGMSSLHMSYPGTVSVSSEHLMHYLQDIILSLVENGVNEIFVVNGHGSNIPAISKCFEEVSTSHNCRLVLINWWIDGRELGLFEPDEYHHAGALETSVLMAIHPDLVSTDLNHDTKVVDYNPYQVQSITELTPNGVIGTVSTASIDRGLEYLDALIDLLHEKYFA